MAAEAPSNVRGWSLFERACAQGSGSEVAGSSASSSANSAQLGPHALLLTFSNLPGTRGKLVFRFRGNQGTNGTFGGSIDIGNQGSVEYTTAITATRESSFTMPASGIVDVRVTNECHVAAGSDGFQSCSTEVWVGFRPDLTATCTITFHGQECGSQATLREAVIGTNRVAFW